MTIDGQPEPATQPALGVDASGRLVVVWEQMVGSVVTLGECLRLRRPVFIAPQP